jgi:glycosyltransferase involved in cell wall biosynthesis
MHFGDQPDQEMVDGVRVLKLPCARCSVTAARLIEMIRFLRLARHRIRVEQAAQPYDVIHAHSILPEGAVGVMRGPDVRTVVTAHGSDAPGYNPDRYGVVHRIARPWWVRTLERTDVVTAPSAFLAELIRNAHPTQTVHVIPNGIITNLFEDRAERGGILIASRMMPRKKVHVALEALRGLPTTTVDVVGDGPELPRLRELAATLTTHQIGFHSWLQHGSPVWRDVHERARFFVFMSAQENFPMDLLEAQLAAS